MFGGGGGAAAAARQPIRGDDLETRVRISFDDSLKGVQVRVPVESEAVVLGLPRDRRRARNVAGRLPGVRRARAWSPTRRGSSPSRSRARAARGTATIVESPCKQLPRHRPRAHAAPVQREDPGGRQDRDAREAQGNAASRAGTAGPPGDLYVVVEVEPSPLFERRGSDLVLDVPVTYAEAALGASVQIPTPDGPSR